MWAFLTSVAVEAKQGNGWPVPWSGNCGDYLQAISHFGPGVLNLNTAGFLDNLVGSGVLHYALEDV